MTTTRLRISDQANEMIEKWAWQLVTGDMELWQLPSSLLTFHTLAFDEGAASRQSEIDQANADADRYYTQLYNPRSTFKPGMSFEDLERIRAEIYYAPEQRRAAA